MEILQLKNCVFSTFIEYQQSFADICYGNGATVGVTATVATKQKVFIEGPGQEGLTRRITARYHEW